MPEERGMEEISKNLPVMQRKKCYTNCLHSEAVLHSMVTQSSTLAWRIPWTEEPGGLQSIGLQRVGRN